MEVCFPDILLSLPTLNHIGLLFRKLFDRSSGHIHYLCARLEEEDEGMGSHDRFMRKRRKNSREIQISVSG
jgi:hypothetical protein